MNHTQSHQSSTLDATFFALADPTRRAILQKLARGEGTVNELAAPFSMSQPAISKHLKVLETAGLISVRQEGRRRPRRLEPEPLEAASDWIERYREIWETNFRRLDSLLAELQEATPGVSGDLAAVPREGKSLSDKADSPGPRDAELKHSL